MANVVGLSQWLEEFDILDVLEKARPFDSKYKEVEVEIDRGILKFLVVPEVDKKARVIMFDGENFVADFTVYGIDENYPGVKVENYSEFMVEALGFY